jgi:hypothetical protein
MKGRIFILFFLLAVNFSQAQPVIKVIIPGKVITAGEPFRIQFVVQHSDNNQRFNPPDFKWFQIIKGPEVYAGTQSEDGRRIEIKNYVYTLLAERAGVYKFSPATVNVNGFIYSGREIEIIVTEKENDFSGYLLLPGEDPGKKIKQNLFVKLFVDKRTCFIGEPVVATFKLYSRLQSKSDIVKNPGFYGFSVYDMVNLDDKVKETEKLNGKDFDVHTIRKVQLYPLQPGLFVIDPMEIENKVEFSRSVVYKKTEQKISEGVLNKDDSGPVPGSEVFENRFSTEPVTIRVKLIPVINRPVNFNGAIGSFSINAAIRKNELAKNEEGVLEIIIKGKGNFTQLTAPVIKWPEQTEGFEPAVTDFLDRTMSPLSGSRVFRYAFISSKPGIWQIPAVDFSFFNKNNNTYKTVFTRAIEVSISNIEAKKPITVKAGASEKKVTIEEANKKVSRIAAILVAFLVAGAFLYWIIKGKKTDAVTINEKEPELHVPTIDEIFEPVLTDINTPGKDFYTTLHHSIWNYLNQQFNFPGFETNKNILSERLRLAGNNTGIITDLVNFLEHCEAGMYSTAGFDENREELINKIKTLLRQVKA